MSADYAVGLNRAFANLVVIVLLPVCFYLLSDVFWKVYYPDPLQPKSADKTGARAVSRSTQAPAASWDWFVIKEPVKASKPATVSKLNASLAGVFGVGDKGVAMIKADGGQVKAYRVGDEIKSGIALKRLGLNYVILLRNGEEEELRMKGGNLFNREEAPQSAGDDKAAGGVNTVDSELAKVIKKEPFKLLDLVRFRQERVPEYGLGYKIIPRGERGEQAINAAGLYKEDMIFLINGRPIVQLPSDPVAMKKLLESEELKIRLLRDGRVMDVTIALN